MTDWADGIEMRNYGIKYAIDGHMVSELVRTIVALVMVAGALLFYSWIRIQIVNTGYENQRLFSLETLLLKDQRKLILEEGTLSSPERIDKIARNELGMIPLHPNQLILTQTPDFVRETPRTMAMADAEGRFGDYPANSGAY